MSSNEGDFVRDGKVGGGIGCPMRGGFLRLTETRPQPAVSEMRIKWGSANDSTLQVISIPTQ